MRPENLANMDRKPQIPYPEIVIYSGADALAQLHRIRCEREPTLCLLCTLIAGGKRKIRIDPEDFEYEN
jgi:hypothetical protein